MVQWRSVVVSGWSCRQGGEDGRRARDLFVDGRRALRPSAVRLRCAVDGPPAEK